MEAKKCVGRKPDGSACGRWPIKGGSVCPKHGANRRVRGKAALRAEVLAWGLNDVDVDPGQPLLKLISQSSARAQRYAEELEKLVEESPTLQQALIGAAYGEFGKQGEYIRGLVRMEAEERDRLARFCGIALSAGLAERVVRAAEERAMQMAEILRAIMGDSALALSDAQRAAFPGAIRRHLALAGPTG